LQPKSADTGIRRAKSSSKARYTLREPRRTTRSYRRGGLSEGRGGGV